MHQVSTKDLYEASYYLTKGYNVENVEVLSENNKKICMFTFSGENLLKSQSDYFNANAYVNLWDFRRCFNRVNALIGTAKKQQPTARSNEQSGQAGGIQ